MRILFASVEGRKRAIGVCGLPGGPMGGHCPALGRAKPHHLPGVASERTSPPQGGTRPRFHAAGAYQLRRAGREAILEREALYFCFRGGPASPMMDARTDLRWLKSGNEPRLPGPPSSGETIYAALPSIGPHRKAAAWWRFYLERPFATTASPASAPRASRDAIRHRAVDP